MTDAKEQAQAQYESICEMLAAEEVDYDRLDELRDEMNSEMSEDGRAEWVKENAVEFTDLEAAAGDCEDHDDALQRIYEDPLSVQVRSGWCDPGQDLIAAEFEILLATGGPAVRIRGELDEQGCPDRAWMDYSGWGTSWERYYEVDQATLLQYVQYFFS